MSRRLAAWVVFVAIVSGIAFASNQAVGKPGQNALYQWSTTVSELIVFAIILSVTFAIAGPHRELLGLRRPKSWSAAAAMALPLFVVVYFAVAALDHELHGSREQGLVPKHWEPAHTWAYVANFVVIAGVAPFAEELLFRGLGFGLLRPFGAWPAILTVGISFGVYHGLVHALPELALFGCALAWLRSRTDSVYPGMVAHATFNAIGLLSVFY